MQGTPLLASMIDRANPARFRHRQPRLPELPTVAWINEPREAPEKTLHADSAKRSHNGSSRGGKVHLGGRYSNPVEVTRLCSNPSVNPA
jgi:hypothetical protein